MDTKRFFHALNKINAVLFFLFILICLIGLVLLLISSLSFGSGSRYNTVQVHAADGDEIERVEYQLGSLESIYGSETYMLELRTTHTTLKISSGGYGSVTRNILFIEGAEMKTHWLFPNNNQIIESCKQLRRNNGDSTQQDVTYNISMLVNKYDTDKDGTITSDDDITAIITDPSGRTITELGTYERIIKTEIDKNNAQYIMLAYRNGNFIFQRFDLDTFLLSTELVLHDISITGLSVE